MATLMDQHQFHHKPSLLKQMVKINSWWIQDEIILGAIISSLFKKILASGQMHHLMRSMADIRKSIHISVSSKDNADPLPTYYLEERETPLSRIFSSIYKSCPYWSTAQWLWAVSFLLAGLNYKYDCLWLQSRRRLSHKGVIFGFEASQYETKNPKIIEWLINSSKSVGKTGKLMRIVCYRGVFFLQGSKLVVNLHNPCSTLRCKHFSKICHNSHGVVHLTTIHKTSIFSKSKEVITPW